MSEYYFYIEHTINTAVYLFSHIFQIFQEFEHITGTTLLQVVDASLKLYPAPLIKLGSGEEPR